MKWAILLLLGGVSVWANGQANDDYCGRTLKNFQDLALQETSRIAFENQGGLAEGGVCWWHSRLQRNSTYMARFEPSLARATPEEYNRLVSDLINEKGPVVIPGYPNFLEFSRDNETMIQNKLEGWQIKDGFFKFGWLRGLKGRSEMKPDELKKTIEKLYSSVTGSNQIEFVIIQPAGIISHSWLIAGVKPLDRGYNLYYIDSNYPRATMEYRYTFGDTTVNTDLGNSGIYINFSGTLKKLRKNFAKFCGKDLK